MAYGDRQNEMIDWLKSQGVVPCDGGKYRPLILSCIGEVAAVYPDLFDVISDVYIYNQWEQECEIGRTSDAICWFHTTEDGVILFAIAISTSAASVGENYLLMCILHELTHSEMILESKWDEENIHSMTFHRILDGFIEKHNRETGRHIVNDYYGLEETERADSKGFTLTQSKTHDRKK